MNQIVVFDFDKTLTFKDSLTELFAKHGNSCTRIIQILLKVLVKLHIISVTSEKLLLINMLFKGDVLLFSEACRAQATQIEPTKIMDILYRHVEDGDRVVILSASAYYLLKEFFKNSSLEILGSEFLVEEGQIKGFIQHPFDKEKIDTLKKHNIYNIDIAYFDSNHDNCLKTLSTQWYRVKNGQIIEHNI